MNLNLQFFGVLALTATTATAAFAEQGKFEIKNVRSIVCKPMAPIVESSSGVFSAFKNADGTFNSTYFSGFEIPNQKARYSDFDFRDGYQFGNVKMIVADDSTEKPTDQPTDLFVSVEIDRTGERSKGDPSLIHSNGLLQVGDTVVAIQCTVALTPGS